MKLVKATREGLIGARTASGYVVDPFVPFVALPSTRAIGLPVLLINPRNWKHCKAIVLDVGPWNTHDDDYVFGDARPQAESGIDLSGRHTNGAGIDLGERAWALLDMQDNGPIAWMLI